MRCLCAVWAGLPRVHSPGSDMRHPGLAELSSKGGCTGFLLRKTSLWGQPAGKLKLT